MLRRAQSNALLFPQYVSTHKKQSIGVAHLLWHSRCDDTFSGIRTMVPEDQTGRQSELLEFLDITSLLSSTKHIGI